MFIHSVKNPFKRSVCNNNILADFSYTCAGSRAAVTLGGPTATRGAWRWNLLLAQLPISQTAPSGAPWGATLWTPHWVPVTPVTWSRWGEIVKEEEIRGESREISTFALTVWKEVCIINVSYSFFDSPSCLLPHPSALFSIIRPIVCADSGELIQHM